MPHLVATLIYLPQNYSYHIRGDRSPLKTTVCLVSSPEDVYVGKTTVTCHTPTCEVNENCMTTHTQLVYQLSMSFILFMSLIDLTHT